MSMPTQDQVHISAPGTAQDNRIVSQQKLKFTVT